MGVNVNMMKSVDRGIWVLSIQVGIDDGVNAKSSIRRSGASGHSRAVFQEPKHSNLHNVTFDYG